LDGITLRTRSSAYELYSVRGNIKLKRGGIDMEANIMGKTILIVDDEKEWVRALAIRLGHAGYRVEVAFDAVNGVAQAINLVPDVILLDIMMPAGGGITALKNIRNSSKTFNIPVIVITAKSDKETKETAKKLGISAYFVKPIDTVKLREKLREVLQYK